MKLKKVWYIFLYHNVDWNLSPFLWNMKGSISPDVFGEQVDFLSKLGKFSNIEDAFQKLQNGSIDEPLISFWFDDFYSGVAKYAALILDQYSIKGAISVNSDFTSHQHHFWRSQLCFLKYRGELGRFVSLAKESGIILEKARIKDSTMSNFSPELITVLNQVFMDSLPSSASSTPFSIFSGIENLKEMHAKGWVISNHTASHYPVTENAAFDLIDEQFQRCDRFINEHLGFEPKFWVLPFDRTAHESNQFSKWAKNQMGKVIVRVGDKPNLTFDQPFLHRINTPTSSLSDLKRHLIQLHRA